jgi:hypothetical protein
VGDEVTERTKPDRAAPTNLRSRLFRSDDRLVMVVAFVLMCLGIFFYGRYLASLDLASRENTITELRSQAQKEQTTSDSQAAELSAMEAKLKKTQARLDSIMPSANTYTIHPNQTLIVGDGHLSIGLVGAPGNDSILLNVNGKEQSAAAGQTINVAPDPATQCQISVQSFDVFNATLVAACSGAKAK